MKLITFLVFISVVVATATERDLVKAQELALSHLKVWQARGDAESRLKIESDFTLGDTLARRVLLAFRQQASKNPSESEAGMRRVFENAEFSMAILLPVCKQFASSQSDVDFDDVERYLNFLWKIARTESNGKAMKVLQSLCDFPDKRVQSSAKDMVVSLRKNTIKQVGAAYRKTAQQSELFKIIYELFPWDTGKGEINEIREDLRLSPKEIEKILGPRMKSVESVHAYAAKSLGKPDKFWVIVFKEGIAFRAFEVLTLDPDQLLKLKIEALR